jgi:hypothetical protein
MPYYTVVQGMQRWHQGLTVTPPVGLCFFPLTPPQSKTHLPEINKPQARICGLEISISYPIVSNICITVTTRLDSLLKITCTWFCDFTVHVCMEGSGTHGRWNWPLEVPSDEHPPAWEQIPPQLPSRVKGE